MAKTKIASLTTYVPGDCADELRALAATLGVKPNTVATMAIREGIPSLKRKIVAIGEKLAAAADE